jgi:retron-type reverse transcriptase
MKYQKINFSKPKIPKFSKEPEILKSNLTYNSEIARSFHKLGYYINQQERYGSIQKIDDVKQSLSTTKDTIVSEKLKKYIDFAIQCEIKIFNVLTKIKNKVRLTINNKQDLPTHNNLVSIISNPYVLLAAYRTIRPNKGTMSKAAFIPIKEYESLDPEEQNLLVHMWEAPDGININLIETISVLLKHNKYPWGVSKRIWIPKPGSDKLRPITIPPFMDKVVQESIRMVLECIYEPVFQSMGCNFGFRASNGCHQALTVIGDSSLTNGLNKALEGDIEGAYPNTDQDIMIKTLNERINDKKFLSIVKKRMKLRLYDTEDNKYKEELIGIPQGGIDSPYLWNIYMLSFDEYVLKSLNERFNIINSKVFTSKGFGQEGKTIKNPPINPLYNKKDKEILKIKSLINSRKGNIKKISKAERQKGLFGDLFTLIRMKKNLQHEKRNIPYYDPNRKKLRFIYLRYADDWIILTNASNHIMEEIRLDLKNWLWTERKAKLSLEKTNITDMRKKSAKFLGFELKCSNTRRLGYDINNILKRTAGWQITIAPDKQRLINRLHMKGYCQADGFPREISWLSFLDPYTIIQKYNAVIAGHVNYYAEFVNYPSSLNRWIYIYRWSCIKTLAQKYHTNCSNIIKKFGKNISADINVTLKGNKKMFKTVTLFQEIDIVNKALSLKQKPKIISEFKEIKLRGFCDYDSTDKQRTPRILDTKFLNKINWVNIRTQANFGLPCSICGAVDNIEMHHVNHVRKRKFLEIPSDQFWEKMMALRGRRQIPLCEKCHKGIHSGKIKYSLKSIEINKLVDNRIVNSENYIISGKTYKGLDLEPSLLSKGFQYKKDQAKEQDLFGSIDLI